MLIGDFRGKIMVMNFFRRPDGALQQGAARQGNADIRNSNVSASGSDRGGQTVSFPEENAAFGAVVEESRQSSGELMSGFEMLGGRLAALIETHDKCLGELGSLRAEHVRVSSLLEYESRERSDLAEQNARLHTENRDIRNENSRLRAENDTTGERAIRVEALNNVANDELRIIQVRLRDAERELADRVGIHEEAAALLKRTQKDLEARNRELSSLREELEAEQTGHRLLVETSARENSAFTREIARLNDERNQLRNTLSQQEALARSLQTSTLSLKQELASLEEKYRRTEDELDSLRTGSALEISHLSSQHEAVSSRAELVERLLGTARERNRSTDDELQATRAEIKRLKAEASTASARFSRLEEEMARARATIAQGENERRDLASENSEISLRLRESETMREKFEHEYEATKRDLGMRSALEREEIGNLRAGLEIARSEIRQLSAERAMLKGQLDRARNERGLPREEAEPPKVSMPVAEMPVWSPAPANPLYELSERAIRSDGKEGELPTRRI